MLSMFLVGRDVSQLGDERFDVREAASLRVSRLGVLAWPALKEAARSKDAEVQKRAADLLGDLDSVWCGRRARVLAYAILHVRGEGWRGAMLPSCFRDLLNDPVIAMATIELGQKEKLTRAWEPIPGVDFEVNLSEGIYVVIDYVDRMRGRRFGTYYDVDEPTSSP